VAGTEVLGIGVRMTVGAEVNTVAGIETTRVFTVEVSAIPALQCFPTRKPAGFPPVVTLFVTANLGKRELH
jgi:hypothetical protein